MRLKAAAPKNAPFRIAGYNADFFPNLSTMYGLEDIRAHDPMESARYVGMLQLGQQGAAAAIISGNGAPKKKTAAKAKARALLHVFGK